MCWTLPRLLFPLSPLLFVSFVARFEGIAGRHEAGDKEAPSQEDLQCSLKQFAAECVAAGKQISIFKPEAMGSTQKRMLL